jgi:hypothetical protein
MHLVGQETGYLSAFGNQVSQTTIANATTVAVRGEELGARRGHIWVYAALGRDAMRAG